MSDTINISKIYTEIESIANCVNNIITGLEK